MPARAPRPEIVPTATYRLQLRQGVTLAEARDAVEDVIEPFLMQQGFIQRTPRGRVACGKAYLHLGLTEPPRPKAQPGLFED